MRLLLAILVASGVMAAVPDTADARKKSRQAYICRDCGPPPYQAYEPRRRSYGYRYRESEHSDSTECIEARALDPGGNYADYPCWAQRALAPKKQF
ncbi:MAG: hypothetical protein KJZ80_08460 [Hyphomicrobiaceae bacterium]|nr:hypothetical protein [Hyphomicrobiaceae bacterium]